jgi:transposase-like protein
MSTGKQPNRTREQFWRRVLRQWRQSGLSVRAFCAAQDLAEPSFYHWRRTLQQRDALSPAFVPVQVVAPQPDLSGSGAVELLLGNGRLLRVGPGFDAATLQRLLGLLEDGQA